MIQKAMTDNELKSFGDTFKWTQQTAYLIKVSNSLNIDREIEFQFDKEAFKRRLNYFNILSIIMLFNRLTYFKVN